MKHTLIAALLAVAAVSAPALADGFYVGADVGRSQLDGLSGVAGISDSNVKATSAGVFGGYAFSPSWAVELGYHGLGKGTGQTKFKNVAVNYDTKVKATTLSVIGSYGVSDAFSVYGRLGYANIRNSTHYGAFEIEETQNKAIAGIGARYAVSKSVGVRAEYTKYAADFSAFGVGVDFSF